jgi:hypothetical protein
MIKPFIPMVFHLFYLPVPDDSFFCFPRDRPGCIGKLRPYHLNDFKL